MTDHLLPRLHIRPPKGFLNDPNGPVVVDGVLHLYFQYRHTTDMAAPVLWGHASSTDLVHWRLHRPAMAPDPAGPDRDGCWSGTTVIGDDGVLRAFYSGFRDGQSRQATLVARSTDGGASFGPPSIAAADPEDVRFLRDPFVWREADGTWSMVVGVGLSGGVAGARLLSSIDLDRFEPVGMLASLPRTRIDGIDTGELWECPQVLDVDGTRVLLVGAWSEVGGTMRVLAALPGGEGDRLDGLGMHPVDDGPDFYAASVLRHGDHGPIVWGWVTEGREDAAWKQAGWAGTISLPRSVRLGSGGRLLSAPHPAVADLRGDPLAEVIGAQAELVIHSTPGGWAELRFGAAETLRLECTADGRVVIDRDRASADPRAHGGRIEVSDAADADGFALRLFVDGSVFELFTSTDRVATFRCYPSAPPPWRITASAGARVEAFALR